MGYYTKHIITIDKDSTREKLMELRDLFPRALNIYDDGHLDDYNWNGGLGSKWYEIRDDLVEVSKEFVIYHLLHTAMGKHARCMIYTVVMVCWKNPMTVNNILMM